MRKTSWSARLAAGVVVVTLVLTGQVVADELSAMGSRRAPHSSPGPSQRPAALDAERPLVEGPEIGTGEARSESPSLPDPARDVEVPAPAGWLPEAVIEELVIIESTPRALRRPRHLP